MTTVEASSFLGMFRFWVDFVEEGLAAARSSEDMPLCRGAFAECTGLEATMEPKVIKEGGRNYGAAQRAGPVTFATVVLKRGMTHSRDLWRWYEMATGQARYSYRLTATITMFDNQGNGVLSWELKQALPVKFKSADLNARGTDVGIEELHLAHEGLTLLGAPRRANIHD
jgi:phage tail-like protein